MVGVGGTLLGGVRAGRGPSLLDAGLARVGRPSEEGGPSKLEVNFH